jgi:hypothetical protein
MTYELVKMRAAHIRDKVAAGQLCMKFIDAATTASNRETFHNTKQEVNDALGVVHDAVFMLDRGVYAALLKLPGLMDYSRQIGVLRLLDDPRSQDENSILHLGEETDVIQSIVDMLPKHRQLNLFLMLAQKNVNNARTKKLILRTVLGWDNLPWAAVKYRRKIRQALTHAWGLRLTSIIKAVLGSDKWDNKSMDIAINNIHEYCADGLSTITGEVISFILGGKTHRGKPFFSDILRAYQDAPTNYTALDRLPPEIAQDFRARYHKNHSVADVMERTKDKLTAKQRVRVQAQAKELGVKVEVKASQTSLVDLFVLAYQNGLTPETLALIEEKYSSYKSGGLPYNNVGVIVDYSASVEGTSHQKWRPVATLAAISFYLDEVIEETDYRMVGGAWKSGLAMPSGETDIASSLVDVLVNYESRGVVCDAIFVLTDGYENAPAGRFAEVVAQLREMGNQTPIYQVTPTFAAESYGTRQLSPLAPVIPLGSQVEALPALISKRMIETDFDRGFAILLEQAGIQLGGAK